MTPFVLSLVAIPSYADVIIDNFSCPVSFTTTGFTPKSQSVTCPGSIGGLRNNVIFISGGTLAGATSVSSINSNPPANALTGTIGPNLSGADVFLWSGSAIAGDWNLANLDLSGDAIRLGIESTQGGTLDVSIGSGPHPDAMTSRLDFVKTFSASGTFDDVVIPLTNPIVTGAGADLSKVTVIGLHVNIAGGSSYTINGVTAVPEPNSLVLLGALLAALLGASFHKITA